MLTSVGTRSCARTVLTLAALTAALAGGRAAADEAPSSAAPAEAGLDLTPYRANGTFTVEVLGGDGSTGRGYGLRLSLGLESASGWRVELGGGGWTEFGGGFEVDRALVDVTLARRLGRIEPWVAVGYARVYAEDGAGPEEGVGCGWLGCLGSMGAPVTMSGHASGPAWAAGLRVTLTSHLLVGVTVRQVMVREVPMTWEDPERLDPLPAPLRVGGTWLGLTVGWRFGGG